MGPAETPPKGRFIRVVEEEDGTLRRPLRIATRRSGGAALVAPSGELGLPNSPPLRRYLLELLRDAGRVVVDLRSLRVTEPDALLLFPAVLSQAGGWPRARLALCAADRSQLDMLSDRQVTDTVPARSGTAEAMAALERRPAAVRRTGWLLAGPDLTAEARLFLDACRADWLPDGTLDEAAHGRLDALLALIPREQDGVLACTAELTDEYFDVSVRTFAAPDPPPAARSDQPPDVVPSVTRHHDGYTVRVSLWTHRRDGGPPRA